MTGALEEPLPSRAALYEAAVALDGCCFDPGVRTVLRLLGRLYAAAPAPLVSPPPMVPSADTFMAAWAEDAP
jgi:hypothetical protein